MTTGFAWTVGFVVAAADRATRAEPVAARLAAGLAAGFAAAFVVAGFAAAGFVALGDRFVAAALVALGAAFGDAVDRPAFADGLVVRFGAVDRRGVEPDPGPVDPVVVSSAIAFLLWCPACIVHQRRAGRVRPPVNA
ncbi:MAG TPA: hypothetical protein VFY18_14120, partial [Candidatus Limnocylindrales bacterium]|nr:hypothetical protein [Candidatus Limnocylindrales bacterium]